MYSYPNVNVTRVNLKPLLPPGTLERVNPQKILKLVQREVLKTLQRKITQSTLSRRAKVALKKGFEIQRRMSSIVVVAKHPAFRPLLEGRRNRQMRWLVKAQRPIPIVTDEGELIFRSATPRSMDNGSWYHPQRQPTTVLEKAREEAREVIKERLRKELRKEIRAAMGRARR
jgi:hypothetical protein